MLPYDSRPMFPAYEYGQDGLRAVLARSRRGSASAMSVERLVPGDAREAALALAPDALHRMQDAVGAVDALEVVIHLRAQEALREAVLGIAADGRPRGRPRRPPS